MRTFFLILISIKITICTFAQSAEEAPVIYDQFFKNYFLLNPSLLQNNLKLQALLGNRTLTGLFEGVSRFYADGNFVVRTEKDKHHSFGILAINNREGEYFSRTRFYGRYSFQTKLTEESELSMGAAIGFVNYSFKASLAGGGGSSLNPDANIGLWYTNPKIKIGLAYQQITKPLLRPVNQTFTLKDYLNITFIYHSFLAENIHLETHGFTKIQKGLPFHAEVAPVFIVSQKLEAGANYRYKDGFAFLVGLRSLMIGENAFQIMMSYRVGDRRIVNISDNVLEFSFGYSLNRNAIQNEY